MMDLTKNSISGSSETLKKNLTTVVHLFCSVHVRLLRALKPGKLHTLWYSSNEQCYQAYPRITEGCCIESVSVAQTAAHFPCTLG